MCSLPPGVAALVFEIYPVSSGSRGPCRRLPPSATGPNLSLPLPALSSRTSRPTLVEHSPFAAAPPEYLPQNSRPLFDRPVRARRCRTRVADRPATLTSFPLQRRCLLGCLVGPGTAPVIPGLTFVYSTPTSARPFPPLPSRLIIPLRLHGRLWAFANASWGSGLNYLASLNPPICTVHNHHWLSLFIRGFVYCFGKAADGRAET
mmetsp:Transcript_7192/g.15688  ORF Transcript_7192/g.15688 Transcript_7192/m.15688 type:complete len:205 (+) Transcript_7192:170-784(+)